MKKTDVVVIGGSAAGLTAAITSRRHHPDKRILMVRKEKQVLIPCGIPYIFGTLDMPEKNLVPDSILTDNQIELMVCEAVSIDRQRHEVKTTDIAIEYDRLIVATGSSPIIPPIPGVDLPGVFAIEKDFTHLALLRNNLENAHNIVIIGGGFIGIEFADEINKRQGLKVTIVELAHHCLSLSYDNEF